MAKTHMLFVFLSLLFIIFPSVQVTILPYYQCTYTEQSCFLDSNLNLGVFINVVEARKLGIYGLFPNKVLRASL